MKLDNLISSVLIEVIAALLMAIIGFGSKKIYSYLKKKWEKFSFGKKKDILLKVTDLQIREYKSGKVVLAKEKDDALIFVKHDLNTAMNNLKVEEERISLQIKSAGRGKFYFVSVLISWVLILLFRQANWFQKEWLSYLLFLCLLLFEVNDFIKWYIAWKGLDQKRKTFLKELNKAMLVLGNTVTINLLEIISKIYDKKIVKNPVKIQEELRTLGFEIERSEIMRATLSYILSGKSEKERIKIIGDVLRNSVDNPKKYDEIPLSEKLELENKFKKDYIDDPYSIVKIIPLQK